MQRLSFIAFILFQLVFGQHAHSDADRRISFPDIKGYKTLICDLHTHTVFSDGSVWPSIRVAEANKDGLDAIAVTEHIEYQPYKEDIPHPDRNRSYDLTKKYAKKSELLVIAGTEITKSMPPGHSNAIFVKDVNKIMNDDYIKSYEAARKQGAFTFWNHPHWIGQRKDASVKVYEEVEELINKRLLHGIEVTNERTYSDQAIQVALDHDLTMIGTSDVHNLVDWDYKIPQGGHRPVTLVFSKRKNLKDLKRSLFQGRTVVWFKNILIGKNEWIAPLIDASLTIDSAGFYKDYELGIVKIKNHSDSRFILKNKSPYDFYQHSDLVEIQPHSVKQLSIVSGKNISDFNLEFEVLNAIIAPSTHPTITFSVRNIGEVELKDVKF